MKKKKNVHIYLLTGLLLISASCKKELQTVQVLDLKIDAPFDMPEIKVPDFINSRKFSIKEYGAIEGDKEKTSRAIAAAIEEASNTGGGTVIIPQGKWLTKKIHLKSYVNLHIDKGAILIFSEKPVDYLPAVRTSWGGIECYNYSPLIYAYECQNVAITGKGEIRARMDIWEKWFSRPPAHVSSLARLYNMGAENIPVEERQMVNDTSHLRPQFIQFNRCENVLLEGISIKKSPLWVIHPYLSKNIVIRDIKVFAHGRNNDGVDPEMCQNVLIENCVFDQGDDAIAVKSGRNQDGWRLDTPSKNIIIKNCLARNAHQLLALGSEVSGGIENVFMDSCEVSEGAKLNHLVFIKTNERRGGYVRNIHVRNIKSGKIDEGILGIETNVFYQWKDLVQTQEQRLTLIEYIYLKNVQSSELRFISRIQGQKELPVKNVFFKNVSAGIIRDSAYIHSNLINFQVEK